MREDFGLHVKMKHVMQLNIWLVFQKSMKMIGASEFSDGKYLKVCVLF